MLEILLYELFKELSTLVINKTIILSQHPVEKKISTALEKLAITNDLKKNGKTTKISSLFKPKILCVIDRIKEKEKRHDIDSIYD